MQKDEKPMRRLTITIPEEYVLGLEDMAADQGTSVSEEVREAVLTHLMDNYWNETIGKVAQKAIKDGKTNEEALAEVRKKFPRAATSNASVAWYRNKLRKENPTILTNLEARSRK